MHFGFEEIVVSRKQMPRSEESKLLSFSVENRNRLVTSRNCSLLETFIPLAIWSVAYLDNTYSFNALMFFFFN